MQQQPERQLHHLEKIVAVFALLAVLLLTVGFAHAQTGKVFLRSSAVLVQDANSGQTILAKNSDSVMPIASITKLMTAMVLLDSGVDMQHRVVVSREDVDHLKGTHSRLRPGSSLTRDDLLLIALMASENRAAAALARTFPGGTEAFVAAMNAKARALGMQDTHYVDPTGLDSDNVSSPRDLARLVKAAARYPLIREYTTRGRAKVEARGRTLAYHNTNRLVSNPHWDIDLSKTGYISEAGRCLVMQVTVASRELIVVLLDSWGKYSRIGDANRIRRWLESSALADSRG
jgi:D-alanyl-D-alanine endopeptidase (penicillin-binding protein 7)